jgi:hypothetical protein
MTTSSAAYPVTYEVDIPEKLSRWMWLVKWLLAIPHLIVLWFVSIGVCVSVVIAWFAILFTGQYPRGLFDFVSGASRWYARVGGYIYHMTEKYPAFSMQDDPAYGIRYGVPYSDKSDRVSVLFRVLLAIPHMIILWALNYLLWAMLLIHIVIVLFTGKPNADIFKILAGINRWNTRAYSYLGLLTDKYPPFSFE